MPSYPDKTEAKTPVQIWLHLAISHGPTNATNVKKDATINVEPVT